MTDTKGGPILSTVALGTDTTLISVEVERSFSEATPRPADCSVALSWRFFIRSTDSANGRYSTLPMSLYDMPAAARIARELSSVPDFGAPTDRLLPLRSASVLMPLSAGAAIWIWFGSIAADGR